MNIERAMDSDDTVNTDGEKKPSGACSSCHRRKLKCDRMPVCSNCKKADIPCVYTPHASKSKSTPTTRDGRRKPRGPYQKGRTVREKELEHIVEILQEKCTLLEARVHSPEQHTSPGSSHGSVARYTFGSEPNLGPVEDKARPQTPLRMKFGNNITNDSIHPSPAQVLELWLIYNSRVDPMNKILHCPSFFTELRDASTRPNDLTSEAKARLFSVYLTSLNAVEPAYVLSVFGLSRDTLMSFYATELTTLLTAAEDRGQMTFEYLQALVIYIGCLRRQPGPGTNLTWLYSLAVRSAQTLGMDNPVTYVSLSPLEVELRRRTWWTICRQESAYAEEIHSRKQSIMHSTDIPLPLNLEDHDLDPSMTHSPVPRVGITAMSFALGMMQIVKTVGKISNLINGKNHSLEAILNAKCKSLKEQSRSLVEDTRVKIEEGILQYCDASRPYDWLLLLIIKIVLTKVEIIVLECPPETDTIAFNTFHDIKVALSLDIIECHQLLLKEEKLKMWRWNFRNTQQWHATIYVLEEVARRPDASFADRVWQVIDIVFADMELLNKHGMKAEDRSKLLDAHGRAIEAKEGLLRCHDAANRTSTLPYSAAEGNFGNSVAGVGAVHDYSTMLRPEPWQIDQSLFDVQEAELADVDDLFWPS